MRHTYRLAFTMIELIFVIVILGILASIAMPKFGNTVIEADISKGRADVAAIRSAIVSERQSRLLQGQSGFISSLDAGVSANTEGVTIFDKNASSASTRLLLYGVVTKDASGHWMKTATNTYVYKVGDVAVKFVYNNSTGTFTCQGQNPSDAQAREYCAQLE